MGVISGKLGNMVGQKNSLVSNKDKQVWRVYQGNVANPKTVKQAHQRSLFVAAKNFQRAFEDILNHSWQGVDYGTKSLNHFRKMVLAGGGSGFPFFYQPKGAQTFIPQQWPISRGSLNINTKCSSDDPGSFYFDGLKTFSNAETVNTVGDVWSKVLEVNPMLHDGDMITVLLFAAKTREDVILPVYDRFIIDVSDDTAFNDALKSQNQLIKLYAAEDGTQPIFVQVNPDIIETSMISCGFIVSRQNGSKASWLRTKSNMYLNSEYYRDGVPYASEEYITACLDSFMNSTNAAESDWYLNQTGENDDEQQGGGGDTPTQTIALESKEAALTPSGSVNAAYLTKGSLRGYIMYNGQYFTLRDHDLTATSFDEGKSFSPSLTTIELTNGLMEEIQAAGYHFYFPIEPDEP